MLPAFGGVKMLRKKSSIDSPKGESNPVPRDTEVESSDSFESQSISPNPEGIF